MKVSSEIKKFEPITITIESEKELKQFLATIGLAITYMGNGPHYGELVQFAYMLHDLFQEKAK